MVLHNSRMLLLGRLRKLGGPQTKTGSHVIFDWLIAMGNRIWIVLRVILVPDRLRDSLFFVLRDGRLLDVVALALSMVIYDVIVVSLLVRVQNLKMVISSRHQLPMARTTGMTQGTHKSNRVKLVVHVNRLLPSSRSPLLGVAFLNAFALLFRLRITLLLVCLLITILPNHIYVAASSGLVTKVLHPILLRCNSDNVGFRLVELASTRATAFSLVVDDSIHLWPLQAFTESLANNDIVLVLLIVNLPIGRGPKWA